MSSFHDSSNKPIPMGILVKSARKIDREERPTPRRKPENGERQIPWLWIAIGGSAGWVVIVLAVALLTRGQEASVEQAERQFPRPIAVDGPLAEAAPAPMVVVPVVANDPGDHVAEPRPAPRPRLVPKQVKVDDVPPAIDIPPEEVPVVAPAAPAPVAPAPARPKVANNDLDLKLFASCEQIGTNVQFMREPPKAFLRARDEKKMVCIVHLSGNLEDPGFT